MTVQKRFAVVFLLFLVTFGAAVLWLYVFHGVYGVNAFLIRGGSYWISIAPDDPRLSPSMRMALRPQPPEATAGPFDWREIEPGFETGELPVIAEGQEVDRILLNRIDPKKFRFIVRNSANGDKDIDQWEQALPDDVLIVNASYFDMKGFADTPIVSEGVAAGPENYDAKAGGFVDVDGAAHLADLRDGDWQGALRGARNALVSYPMLIGADGAPRTGAESHWLSNRTFLAQDGAGRILVGTTSDAFFSLARLGPFLKEAPLDLKLALNLDGGPIACQSVRLEGFTRKFYARWESQFHHGKAELLRATLPSAHWAMPMVFSVQRR